MKDDIIISCPHCKKTIDVSELLLSEESAQKMANEAMNQVPDRFSPFFAKEFFLSDRGYRHFYHIVCKVCGKAIVAPYYKDDVFEKWVIYDHSQDCPIGQVLRGEVKIEWNNTPESTT